MDTCLDMSLAAAYTSHSQRARVVTENWVERNMYCPRCGCDHLKHLEANLPVADFACPRCGEIFESKAKRGALGRKVADGAYDTMIRRIHESDNPDFLFMSYDLDLGRVQDFLIVPKHFSWILSLKNGNLWRPRPGGRGGRAAVSCWMRCLPGGALPSSAAAWWQIRRRCVGSTGARPSWGT